MGIVDRSRNQLKRIGFWADLHNARGIGRLISALEGLPEPKALVDKAWDPVEREIVATYLDSAPDVEQWLGTSYCRFECGEINMGSSDKSDGTYLWPEGFSHYVRKHLVRPPVEFVEHVRRVLGNLPSRR